MANRMERQPVAGDDMSRGAGGRAAHRRNPSPRTSHGFPSSGFPIGTSPLSSPAGFDCNPGVEEAAQHGSFMSLFNNPFIPHSAFSSPGPTMSNKFIDLEKEDTSPLGPRQNNTRTVDRLMWKQDEDERLMSAWLKHSIDSAKGNAKKGEKYWGDVAKEYDLTTPQNRKRNQKQVKERWHKINKWTNWSPFFEERVDATGRQSLTTLQKCVAAIRMLAYGTPADMLDDHLKLGASTALECLGKFAKGVIEIFGPHYLRPPTTEELEKLLLENEARGFPAGSNNDINVLNRSPLFIDTLRGEAPKVQYTVNGKQYNTGYYLADGIYPEWAVFVKTIAGPQSEKDKLFARHQEGARKDVECAFGVLQSRFNIVTRPARMWKRRDVVNIMQVCVILHNMIVEDEKDLARVPLDINEIPGSSIALPPEVSTTANPCFAQVLQRNAAIQARSTHVELKNDLVEHIWNRYGTH
ncbi:hypothetical protein EJB05_45428, partial [Eragrostis curvula]